MSFFCLFIERSLDDDESNWSERTWFILECSECPYWLNYDCAGEGPDRPPAVAAAYDCAREHASRVHSALVRIVQGWKP